jgi:hypothetical protein
MDGFTGSKMLSKGANTLPLRFLLASHQESMAALRMP